MISHPAIESWIPCQIMVGAQLRHEPEFERVESHQIDSLKHLTMGYLFC